MVINVCGVWVRVPEPGRAVNVPKGLSWSAQKPEEPKPLWMSIDEAIHNGPAKKLKRARQAAELEIIQTFGIDDNLYDFITDLTKSNHTAESICKKLNKEFVLNIKPGDAWTTEFITALHDYDYSSAYKMLHKKLGHRNEWDNGNTYIMSERKAHAAMHDPIALSAIRKFKDDVRQALAEGRSVWEQNYIQGNATGKGRKKITCGFDTREEFEAAVRELLSNGNSVNSIAETFDISRATVRNIRDS